MTKSQVENDLFNRSVCWVIHVFGSLIKPSLISELESSFRFTNSATLSEIERASRTRELLEFHDITSQSACLVREYVLDLTKLFVDVSRLGLHSEILVLIIHHQIHSHETTLPEFDDFKSHNKRDGYEIGENQDPGARSLDEKQAPVGVPFIFLLECKVLNAIQVVDHPGCSNGGAD